MEAALFWRAPIFLTALFQGITVLRFVHRLWLHLRYIALDHL